MLGLYGDAEQRQFREKSISELPFSRPYFFSLYLTAGNPPFNLSDWNDGSLNDDQRWRYGLPPAGNANFAWLQHMVNSMDEHNGRLAVVLPQGVLFRGGKEGEIRKKMIESNKLEYVISLVSGVFYSTGVSACVLVLNNKKPNIVIFYRNFI